MAGAQAVNHAPRLWTGDPLAVSGCGGDAAIKTRGEFERHEGPPDFVAHEEPGEITPGLFCHDAGAHLDARRAQHGKAPARDARIIIVKRGHDPRDARRNKCLGAGWGLAVMGARLERDIGRGPARQFPRLCQRLRFGMGPPARRGPATPDDAPALHDDAAHGGVGRALAHPPPPQRQGQRHKAGVGAGHASGLGLWAASSGRNSLTKRSKSSAS